MIFYNILERNYKEPPILFTKMTKKLGIGLYETETFSRDISGKIYYDNDTGKYRIVVNSNHPKTRMRFTIAHE